MKKFIIIMSVMAGVLFMGKSEAQINISINLGSQPAWGPSGYNHVDYYYLPDINAYYNVATAQYIYMRNNRWHFAKKLPNRFRNYNIYNSYKVVVNRQNPYQNNIYDIQHYSQYKGRTGQAILRDNRAYAAMHSNNLKHTNNYKKTNTVKHNTQTVTRNTNTVTKRTTSPAVRNASATRTQPAKKVTRSTVTRSR